MALTPEQENYIRRLYEKYKPKNMTFLEVMRLYEFFLDKCREIGIDPAMIDFEAEVDWSLSYYENQAILETKILKFIPTPIPEFEELEYYKKRVEELEKRVRELERLARPEVVDKLKKEIEEWKRKYEEAKRMIEKIKATKELTEEDVRLIVRETIKEVTLPLGEILKGIVKKIKELERAVAEVPTIEKVEVTLPAFPPREKRIIKKIDVLTKEEYEADVDFEFRVTHLARLAGFSIPRIFYETSDKTRKAIGYPTWWELAKSMFRQSIEQGTFNPSTFKCLRIY
jgi:hypothetical protein